MKLNDKAVDFSDRDELIFFIMRLSLGGLFFIFGLKKLIYPSEWLNYVPEWFGVWSFDIGSSIETILIMQGGVECLVGLFLCLGVFVRWVALTTVLFLCVIIYNIGLNFEGLRDLALLFGLAVPLMLRRTVEYSLESFFLKKGYGGKVLLALAPVALLILFINNIGFLKSSESHQKIIVTNKLKQTNSSPRNEPIKPLPQSVNVDPEMVSLGKLLFDDRRLSKDNTISCSHCHNLKQGGDDNLQFSVGINLKTSVGFEQEVAPR